jgi:hypothetical protein
MTSGELYIAERTMGRRLQERHSEMDVRKLARGRDRFYSGALAWLGDRLIAWGSGLQERYNTAAPAATPQPANR